MEDDASQEFNTWNQNIALFSQEVTCMNCTKPNCTHAHSSQSEKDHHRSTMSVAYTSPVKTGGQHLATAEQSLLVERYPFQLQVHLSGLDVLQPQRDLLLHLAVDDVDGAVLGERVVLGLEPLADLHVREQVGVSERHSCSDHRLQVNLGLAHYVVLGYYVVVEHLLVVGEKGVCEMSLLSI